MPTDREQYPGPSPVLLLDRNHITVVPLGDDRILKHFLVLGVTQEFIQCIPDGPLELMDVATDPTQFRTGIISHFPVFIDSNSNGLGQNPGFPQLHG